MLGGCGSRASIRFVKMPFMMHCDFENDLNINIIKILLVGGGYKKSTLYALENVHNSGRPLVK